MVNVPIHDIHHVKFLHHGGQDEYIAVNFSAFYAEESNAMYSSCPPWSKKYHVMNIMNIIMYVIHKDINPNPSLVWRGIIRNFHWFIFCLRTTFKAFHWLKTVTWSKRPCDRFWLMKCLKFVFKRKLNQSYLPISIFLCMSFYYDHFFDLFS